MPTQDIPRTEWPAFLDTFSRQHEGWLTTVEIVTTGLGVHREVRDKPLNVTACASARSGMTRCAC